MRTSTVQNVLKGLWAKNQQMEEEQLDQLQRETELTEELHVFCGFTILGKMN